jgi:hypothetical protein
MFEMVQMKEHQIQNEKLEVGSVNIEENALISLHMYCLRELTDRF